MLGKIFFSSQLAAAATYWLHRSPCHTLASSNCETWLNANKSRQQVTRGDNIIIQLIIINTACSLHLTPAHRYGTISLDNKVSVLIHDCRLKNHFFGDRTRCVQDVLRQKKNLFNKERTIGQFNFVRFSFYSKATRSNSVRTFQKNQINMDLE